MWKKIGCAIQSTQDCKVKIIEDTTKTDEGFPYCLWLGDGEFPIMGELWDYAAIRDGITAELRRLGYEDYEQERRKAEEE